MKHSANPRIPEVSLVKDPATRNVLQEICRLIYKGFGDIYDDLKASGTVEVVAALPTASREYRGKFFLKIETGNDTLHVCVLNTGTGAYSWKAVTIS